MKHFLLKQWFKTHTFARYLNWIFLGVQAHHFFIALDLQDYDHLCSAIGKKYTKLGTSEEL